MINADMRLYLFSTFGVATDDYGQEILSTTSQGSIKMSVNITSQSISENINYKDATYIGLTQDPKVNDTYVIDYEGIKLKVLYVIPKGRYKQVFMSEYAGEFPTHLIDGGLI